MNPVSSIKRLLQTAFKPLRRKVYRVRNASGDEWLIVSRKGEPNWTATDISPEEFDQGLATVQELVDTFESDDIDESRFVELQEKAFGKRNRPAS